jgi:hypothetical protein
VGVSAHPIGRCDDKDLQSGIIDRVKTLNIAVRIAAFLKCPSISHHSDANTMGQTDLAELSKRTDIPLDRDVTPILSLRDIRHFGERVRIDVAPAKVIECCFALAEDWFQVTRPAQRAIE